MASTISKWSEIIDVLLHPEKYSDEDGNVSFTFESLTLNETNSIILPRKIDLYEDLDITEKDKVFVNLKNPNDVLYSSVLFVNGTDRCIGKFTISRFLNDKKDRILALTAKASDIDFSNHESTKYFFIFCEKSMKMYKVPVDEVSYQRTQTTSTHLCIDFGTSNTTAGCFLDEHYVENISNIAKINGNVILNAENVATYPDRDRMESQDKFDTIEFKKLAPTIVYVEDCKDPENIKYLFAYEAARKIKEDNYCPQASCFMEIKRWTSNIDVLEDIQDAAGNRASVKRRDIISKYLMFVIRTAENQFKCKFKNIHISAPVKLKDKVLKLYSEILQSHGYVLEVDNAIDEGVAVLYSIISNQIKDMKDKNDNCDEGKALIIDCGGGTSDLASCKYKIDRDEDGIINLDIITEYMNGDVNFGGNNLTYRIMQYMKIVYAEYIAQKNRVNIDDIIMQDVNSMFSYIEGELENDDDAKVKERYEEVYKKLDAGYQRVESVIPTRYKDYENMPHEVYNKVKNNFYFLWKLAEEMKKEFYRSTSISRYTFRQNYDTNGDIDLHVNRIENWRLSIQQDGKLEEQQYPEITFTAKEIDKLLRADIYYVVRKFLNELYKNDTLNTYSQIKLSGQSSKINIFMDSLKEFLPGKKIKSGKIHSKGNDAEELKLLCLKGAILYMHALEKSNIEVNLTNDTQNIPISVYIKNENGEKVFMFYHGSEWSQPAARRRITQAGKEIYLHMMNADREIGEPYKYVYENMNYKKTTVSELESISNGKIGQSQTDELCSEKSCGKKYIFVFLDKDKWGFGILPLYGDDNGNLFHGALQFCSFEMDILQETFFDGRK